MIGHHHHHHHHHDHPHHDQPHHDQPRGPGRPDRGLAGHLGGPARLRRPWAGPRRPGRGRRRGPGAGPFRRPFGAWHDPEAVVAHLEEVQRDLEQAAADIAEQVRRLRAEIVPPAPTGAAAAAPTATAAAPRAEAAAGAATDAPSAPAAAPDEGPFEPPAP
jgi:hypothetical protein